MNVLYLVGFSPVEADNDDVQELASNLTLEVADISSIRCWFRYIEAEHFQGPEADANLANLEWLTPRVLLHEAAVSSIAENVALCPTRFGTLFSSIETLSASVGRWTNDLQAFFARIRGQREWGLKIYMDRKRFESQLLARQVPGDPEKVRGADYLRLKRARQNIGIHTENTIEEITGHFEADTDALGLDFARRSINSAAIESEDMELIANLAILADQQKLEQLTRQLEDYLSNSENQQCFRMQLTGPWAAYSFCPNLE